MGFFLFCHIHKVYIVLVVRDCFKCLKRIKWLYIGKCGRILLVSRTAAKSRHVAANRAEYSLWFNKEPYKLKLNPCSAKFLHSVTAFSLIWLWVWSGFILIWEQLGSSEIFECCMYFTWTAVSVLVLVCFLTCFSLLGCIWKSHMFFWRRKSVCIMISGCPACI